MVVVDEAAPAVDETVPAEPVALTEVLEQLPQGTDVQVVDENGEILPLATQEAADTVATGDPIWCPSTVLTPLNNAGGCSPSYTTFDRSSGYRQMTRQSRHDLDRENIQ